MIRSLITLKLGILGAEEIELQWVTSTYLKTKLQHLFLHRETGILKYCYLLVVTRSKSFY